MHKRLLFSMFLIHVFDVTYIYTKPKKLFVAPSCKLPDGKEYGDIQKNINRAGVIVIVPLSKKSSNLFENYGIIFGFDKNLKVWMVGQAGKSDDDDISTAVTASRELEEETGGYYRLRPEEIEKLPYLSVHQKQMFIYTSHDVTLPSKIKKAVKKAQSNSNLRKSYKEINDVEVVSLQELFDLAEKIDHCKIQRGKYFVTTTTGKVIRLNTLYVELFAHRCDHKRLVYARKMFQDILK